MLASAADILLLRAVAAGRVVRGAAGGDTALMASFMLDGAWIRLELTWLARQDLIEMPISGPPRLAPRGARLLAAANGEVAFPGDQ